MIFASLANLVLHKKKGGGVFAPMHEIHQRYGEYEITVEIESGVINGRFPRRALRLVLEWLELSKDELLENWQLAEEKKPLNKIAPLE